VKSNAERAWQTVSKNRQ